VPYLEYAKEGVPRGPGGRKSRSGVKERSPDMGFGERNPPKCVPQKLKLLLKNAARNSDVL